MATWRFDAIGTGWQIDSETDLTDSDRSRVMSLIDRFDREWSRFRDDSVVTRLAENPGTVAAPADTVAMLDRFAEMSDATAGAVNPLVGDSLAALGYDAAYSLRGGASTPAPAEWRGILSWNADALALAAPATIDVGALGKGRLVDLVLAALDHVPGAVTVDASGDIATRGRDLRIALEHPFDATRAIGVVTVRDQALCASATNRRAWGSGLHHVLDARTGVPVVSWAATWAIADDAMTADAAATALFFDGGPELAGRWGVDWVRVSTDGRAQRSSASAIELFTSSR